jgi:hypothetical protein
MAPCSRPFPLVFRFLAAFCLWSTAAAATASEARVDLAPRWQAGSHMSYELAKTRTKQGSSRDLSATSRTDVQIEVIQATDEDFLVRATFGETRYEDEKTQSAPLVRQLANLMKGLDVEMVVDREGAVQRIRNWADIHTHTSKLIQVLTEFLKQSGAPAAMVEQLSARLKQTFSTEDSIRTAVMRELNLLFLPLGKTYSETAPVHYASDVPALFGAGTLKSKGSYELTSLDADRGLATIRWTQSVDPQDLAKHTEAVAGTLKSAPAPSNAQVPTMTLNDTAEFVVDLHSGWPVSIAHTRRVESGAASQTETTVFKTRQVHR